jgi:hypothetical protein
LKTILFFDLSLVDWWRVMGKTEEERDEVNIRSFLGKMISLEKKL